MSIGLVMTAVFAVYLLVCVIWARLRGVTRSRIRMITVVVSAVLAFIATLIVKASLVGGSLKSILYDLVGENGADLISELAAVSPVLEEILLKTGGGLLAPLLYFLFFLVFCIVTWVLYFIVTLALVVVIHRKEKTRKSKNVPCLIQGLVQGVVCLAVLLVPISTYSAIVPKITDGLVATLPEGETAEIKEINKQVEDINKSPAVVLFRVTGGRLVGSVFTDYSVNYNGEKVKVKLTNEVGSIAELAAGAMELTAKPVKDFTEVESQAIVALGESIKDSKIVSVVAAELVHNATGTWKEGEEFMGAAKPEVGELAGPIFDKLIGALYTGSGKTDTFNEDIRTITKLVAKLVETNVLTSIGGENNELVTAISQKGVVTGIAAVLEENPRLRALVPEITMLSVKILAQSVGVPENDEAVYTAMLNNIAAKLNELRDGSMSQAEQINVMEVTLKAEFKKAGVEIESEYISDVANALVADFGDSIVEINGVYISEFFDIYADRMAGKQGGSGDIAFNGTAAFEKLDGGNNGNSGKKYTYYKYNPDEGGAPENSAAAALANDMGSENLASLKSKETANTNATTIEKLTTYDNITPETLTKEEVQKEAEALEGMLGCVSGIITNENASFSEVIKGVGEALDNLAQTEIFGKDKTGDLFEAVLGSDTIGDLLTDEEKDDIADKVANSENLSYESLFAGVSSIVELIESLTESETSTIELDVVKNLIRSLTEENVNALSCLITGNRFGDMGIPAGKLDNATAFVKDLLTEIGKFKEEARIDDEAKAIKNMIDIALTAKGESGILLFGEEGRLGCTAYEMIEMIMDSTAARNTLVHGDEVFDPFGLALVDGEHKIAKNDIDEFKTACDAYYADHHNDAGVDAEILDEELTMLASILGIVR